MTRTHNKPSFRRSGQRAAVLAERARAMRGSPTASEELLWARIRGRRLGVVIRRQVPLLGRFIADFLAPAQRLVIEVDGDYHGGREAADSRRDAALARAGYRVVRVEASLVVSNIESGLDRIRAALVG
ncbi:MAG TPA: endonuclease domain-containing protein [Polyangiaceae bacterium]|nr:endonuclease domain-containing protein [Polyangiaceae bacterium]